MKKSCSRREFIQFSAGAAWVTASGCASISAPDARAEPIIDIHQHTHYHGRSDQDLIAHQRALGVSLTVLLPAGSSVIRPSTLQGRANGLQAQCYGNQSVLDLTRARPKAFLFFANEVPDLPEAPAEIRKYLRLGARGIGEQKFGIECDSPHFTRVAEVAQDFGVPVLLHFQEGEYNTGFARFHKVLEKFPRVNFIGHAQSWWGNIDQRHDPSVMYPKGQVTPGGLTDRWLADYPNIFGDCSAGSGLNALTRDEDFTRAFLARHQDKLLFGSDCADTVGQGAACQGAQILAAIRRLAPNERVVRKILHGNAARLLKQ